MGRWAAQTGQSISASKPRPHPEKLRSSYRLDCLQLWSHSLPHSSVFACLDQECRTDKRVKGVVIKIQNQQQEHCPDLVPVRADGVWERTARLPLQVQRAPLTRGCEVLARPARFTIHSVLRSRPLLCTTRLDKG